MKHLALLGGPKTIHSSASHFPWPVITKKIENAVVKQLYTSVSIYNRSGIFEKFEDMFKRFHGRKFALLTSSGTSALHSMYVAANLKPGDEVICPAYTFYATVTPIFQTGAVPILCDSDETGNIDPAKIENKITANTKAVVITHMWGIPCDMEKIVSICKKHNLLLFEDCSHAHGTTIHGKLVGTFGDIAAWSLQGQKIVTGGEGGILVTDDPNMYYRALLLGHYNKRCLQEIPKDHPLAKYSVTGMGLKLRAHPLAITMAKELFKTLDGILSWKRKYADMIRKAVQKYDFLTMPAMPERAKPSWYALVLRYDEKKTGVPIAKFYEALKAEGCAEADIPSSTCPLNYLPLFQNPGDIFPAYRNKISYTRGQFPMAEKFYASTIKFPVWTKKTDLPMVKAYIRAIQKVATYIEELR